MSHLNTRCGWTPTPDAAPFPKYGFSVRLLAVNDRIYSKLIDTLQPPTSDLFGGPPLCDVDVGSLNASTRDSGVEAPLPQNYQSHLEVINPASCPSQFSPLVEGDDLLLAVTEGSSAYTQDLRLSPSFLPRSELSRPYFPPATPTPIPEMNVNTNTRYEPALLPYDRQGINISREIHPNESGGFSTSTVTNRSMRGNRIATTSLGTSSIYSTLSSQTPETAHFDNYPRNRPPNHSGSIDLFSNCGNGPAPSGFRSERQRRSHAVAVSPITSSQVPAPCRTPKNPNAPRRTPQNYWCETCGTGFTQRQVLLRHRKDVHDLRQLCPHCGDFKWSPGRKYTLRKHFKEEHPGVALPEFLQLHGSRSSRLRRGTSSSYPTSFTHVNRLHSYGAPPFPLPTY